MLTPPAAVQALLFASGEPLKKKQLSALLGLKEQELTVVIEELTKSLQNTGISLIETGAELELRTSPEAATIVKKLRESELSRDLGSASLETLAVIAYQSGSTRSEIDWVRGVNSSTSLRNLLLRGLIEGKADENDKRRIQYTLTTEALAHLGISNVSELPRAAELSAAASQIIDEESARANAQTSV